MKSILFLFALVLPLFAEEENLVSNGDFQKKKSGWKGDGKADFEGDNIFLTLDVDSRDLSEIVQKVRTKDLKDLILTFKARKSDDYDGRGFYVRFERPDGSYTFYTHERINDDWSDFTVRYGDLKDSKYIFLKFLVREGEEGSVDFDDIVLVGE